MVELVELVVLMGQGGTEDMAGLVAVVEFLIMAAAVPVVVVIQVVAAVVHLVVVVVVVHMAYRRYQTLV
jgi:hypothetical protein